MTKPITKNDLKTFFFLAPYSASLPGRFKVYKILGGVAIFLSSSPFGGDYLGQHN